MEKSTKTYNFLTNEIVKTIFIENGAPKVKSNDKVSRVYNEDSVTFNFEHKKATKVLKSLSDINQILDIKPTAYTLSHEKMNKLFLMEIREKKLERICK